MIYNKIPILYFHSISATKDKDWYKSFLSLDVTIFEYLIRYLNRKKYRFISLDEYFEIRKDPAARNKKFICLTFDDGYLDNYVFAFPILKKYNAKGTLFISPDFVQKHNRIRPTVEQVWSGASALDDLEIGGFVSWEELRLMEHSGIIDVQSHTLTHTKYVCSDKLVDFHNYNSDYLYHIGNRFPERVSEYIRDSEFVNLLPFGMPFFELQSSLITRKAVINETFEEGCVLALEGTNWENYNFDSCLNKVNGLYDSYKEKDLLIKEVESEIEYQKRVVFEIRESKSILENELGKNINHVCWPHGDYNDFCHQTAIQEGHKSSLIVLGINESNDFPDRFDRMGISDMGNNRFLSLLKARYKIGSYLNIVPWSWLKSVYVLLKYGSKEKIRNSMQ